LSILALESLLAHCRAFGVEFAPGSGSGKLKIHAPEPLPEPLLAEVTQRKEDILALLDAVEWLRRRLGYPQRIATVITEWSTRDSSRTQTIDVLMNARRWLGVIAYVGEDDRFW